MDELDELLSKDLKLQNEWQQGNQIWNWTLIASPQVPNRNASCDFEKLELGWNAFADKIIHSNPVSMGSEMNMVSSFPVMPAIYRGLFT